MAHALRYLIMIGLIVGVGVTVLGLFADRWPALELLNHGRPAVLAGVAALAVLALATRRPHLIAAAVIVAAGNVLLFGFALQGVASASTGIQARFLRVVTFNVWLHNQRLVDIANFLNASGADIAVLQEIMPHQRVTLRLLLAAQFPYMTGTTDVVIFSKHPPHGGGYIDGERMDRTGKRPMLVWATFDVDGTAFDLAGVHLAYPFRPHDQANDMPRLIDFVRSRDRPLIVAGDFNLTPWSMKLQRFTRETGLKRYNTFTPTWPMNRLMPFVTIDNVFASKQFAPLKVATAPAIGSDHRPIIADIALVKPPSSAPIKTSANYP